LATNHQLPAGCVQLHQHEGIRVGLRQSLLRHVQIGLSDDVGIVQSAGDDK
jgi:hypothetical protein